MSRGELKSIALFGQYFKKMRQKRGLTLRKFCFKHGIDPGNISKLERGIISPPRSREKLEEYAGDKPRIYFPLGFDEKEDKVFIELKKMMYWKGKKGKKFPPIILCPRKLIHEIRLIKSSKDITMLEKAADITKRGFVKAMKESRPGMFEYQVQLPTSESWNDT